MTGRTPCSIAFCRRTTKGRWAYWMCPDHWRLVDRSLKLLRLKLRRRYQALGEIVAEPGGYRWTSARSWRAASGLHKRMIRQATARAAGL